MKSLGQRLAVFVLVVEVSSYLLDELLLLCQRLFPASSSGCSSYRYDAGISGGGGRGPAAAARQVREHVDAVPRLAPPDGAIGRWLDFYSTADPVPNGPLRDLAEG